MRDRAHSYQRAHASRYVMKRFPPRGIFPETSVQRTFPTNSPDCRILDAPFRKFEVTLAIRNIAAHIFVPCEMPASACTRKYRIYLISIYTHILCDIITMAFGNRASRVIDASILGVIRTMKSGQRMGT